MSTDMPLVLVVDDDPAAHGVACGALSKLGYSCLTAPNGQEALELVAKHPVDLVLTDLEMPVMGGLDLINALRKDQPGLPIVIMTAHADVESARQALRLRVSDYLIKPFEDLSELQAAARLAIQTGGSRGEPDELADELGRRLGQPRKPESAATRIEDGQGGLGQIGGYHLLEELGEGASGRVYKATQIALDRTVALKVLGRGVVSKQDYVQRFTREARIAARLDHVNIVRAIDAGQADGHYYFAMEYVDGGSVADLLGEGKPLPESRALEIAGHVAQALEYAWDVQLIHRDIKPHNILLTTGGVTKLADLGLAKDVSAESTMTGMVVGSPGYISPEQVKALKNIDTRADIYSLGATLYHMVVGRPPFEADTVPALALMHAKEEPVPARERNHKVSKATSSIIHRMLRKHPGDRYANPSDLLTALKGAAGAA